jgi:uncharacterized membrane protein YqjE
MSGGLLNSPRRLLHSVLGLTANRAELFAIEWQEERSRFVGLLCWLAATLFLAIMTALAVTATVLLLIDDPRTRLMVAAFFCALYLVGAIIAGVTLCSRLRATTPPFSVTLDEMKRDRELFQDT